MEDKAYRDISSQLGPLAARFRRLMFPILIGFFLILFIGFGLVYFQQQQAKKSLSNEIELKELQLTRPVAVEDKLQRYYEAVEKSIPARITGEDVIAAVLGIAKKGGFDIDPETTDISINQKKGVKKEKVVKSDYEVLSFTISGVQGDYKKVLAFISMLYSEPGLNTIVLDKVNVVRDEDGVSATATIDFGVYIRPVKK